MGGIYLLLLLVMNLCLRGYKFLPLRLYLFIPSVALFTVGILQIIFKSCCLIYALTTSILGNGRHHLTNVVQRKTMRRVLKSLSPVAIPVGNIGIMDNIVAATYLQSLMSNVVNLMIATKDVFR